MIMEDKLYDSDILMSVIALAILRDGPTKNKES